MEDPNSSYQSRRLQQQQQYGSNVSSVKSTSDSSSSSQSDSSQEEEEEEEEEGFGEGDDEERDGDEPNVNIDTGDVYMDDAVSTPSTPDGASSHASRSGSVGIPGGMDIRIGTVAGAHAHTSRLTPRAGTKDIHTHTSRNGIGNENGNGNGIGIGIGEREVLEREAIIPATQRLRAEWNLLWKQKWIFAACLFVLIYGAGMVFRNLAFYRFVAGDPLKDLGFEILPSMPSGSWIDILSAVAVITILLVMCLMLSATLCANRLMSRRKPYMVNILQRWLTMLAIAHVMRFCTYISTSFPGSSEQCSPEYVNDTNPPPPQDMVDVFFLRYPLLPGQNCGDLLFSSNVVNVVVPVLLYRRYARDAFAPFLSPGSIFILQAILWFMVAIEAIATIALRYNYTTSVVVALYLVPLTWHCYCRAIHPKDASPSGFFSIEQIAVNNSDNDDDVSMPYHMARSSETGSDIAPGSRSRDQPGIARELDGEGAPSATGNSSPPNPNGNQASSSLSLGLGLNIGMGMGMGLGVDGAVGEKGHALCTAKFVPRHKDFLGYRESRTSSMSSQQNFMYNAESSAHE